MIGLAPGETKERDLSWLDWSVPSDLSRDGKIVLFQEAGEGGGPKYAVYSRQTDGSPAIRLGEGTGMALSPDGNWVLARPNLTPAPLILLPMRIGEMKPLKDDGLNHIRGAWMPDGKRITFAGNQPGHLLRTYLLDISGGSPLAITPEGIVATVISPDGKYIAGVDSSMRVSLYPMDGGAPKFIPGLPTGFTPAQWSEDSSAIYVYRQGEIPLTIYRVNIKSGKQEIVRALEPAGRAGVVSIGPIALSRDASRCVYSYYQTLSVMYVISGLK